MKLTVLDKANYEKYVCDIVIDPEEKGKLQTTIYATTFPTSNCQVSTIGSFGNLLYHDTLKGSPDAFDELLSKMRNTYRNNNQLLNRQILIDILTSQVAGAKKLLGNQTIVFENQYISTNGTDMTMIFFRHSDDEYNEESDEDVEYEEDDIDF